LTAEVARLIERAQAVTVLTGAGMSQESGVQSVAADLNLVRMFHKLHSPSLVFCPHKEFSSVGRMARYDAPSENPLCKQNPARSSSEFVKHAG